MQYKKGREMPKKIIKTTNKKNVKPVARKTKTVRADVRDEQMHEQTCNCGCGCHCGCGCGTCRGHRVIGWCIKIVVLCIVFLLGCVSSQWLVGGGHKKSMMRDIRFDDNGCVILESVKCPKLLEVLSTADDDANGCISRAELKNAMHDMKREHRMAHDAEIND